MLKHQFSLNDQTKQEERLDNENEIIKDLEDQVMKLQNNLND